MYQVIDGHLAAGLCMSDGLTGLDKRTESPLDFVGGCSEYAISVT
jgi:hypothetical protein